MRPILTFGSAFSAKRVPVGSIANEAAAKLLCLIKSFLLML
jgi:hypothetical protein